MKVTNKNIFGEPVAVRVRAKAQPDVVPRDPIAGDFILIALVKRKPDRVFADLVLLKVAVVGRLENEPVTDVVDEIVFHARVVGERKIDAVPRVAHFVPADQISFTIPLVNSVATAVCNESGVTVLGTLADSFFHRLG